MVLNYDSKNASREEALEMLYALCILERWETCWGLYKALSLTRNQAVLYGDIGCPPVLGGSGIYLPQKFEISINRKHGLDHDYDTVTIKFSMINTRVTSILNQQTQKKRRNVKQKYFSLWLEVISLCIQVFTVGDLSRIDRCSWDNCNIY